MIKVWYAVRKGRKSNVVVNSWSECEALVKGFPGAIYKGFGLYDKDEAVKFSKQGDYGKHTPKDKPETSKRPYSNSGRKCLQRKSYTDPFTGEYYQNRCVMRDWGTITGKDYVESSDTSCPF